MDDHLPDVMVEHQQHAQLAALRMCGQRGREHQRELRPSLEQPVDVLIGTRTRYRGDAPDPLYRILRQNSGEVTPDLDVGPALGSGRDHDVDVLIAVGAAAA